MDAQGGNKYLSLVGMVRSIQENAFLWNTRRSIERLHPTGDNIRAPFVCTGCNCVANCQIGEGLSSGENQKAPCHSTPVSWPLQTSWSIRAYHTHVRAFSDVTFSSLLAIFSCIFYCFQMKAAGMGPALLRTVRHCDESLWSAWMASTPEHTNRHDKHMKFGGLQDLVLKRALMPLSFWNWRN